MNYIEFMEILKLVGKMRKFQNEFRRRRDGTVGRKAEELEKQVDEIVERYGCTPPPTSEDKSQLTIFGQ